MTEDNVAIRQAESDKWWSFYLEALKLAKDYGTSTIQALLLINGGAVVALLAFIANSDFSEVQISAMKENNFGSVFVYYGFGVISAIVASGMGYVNFSMIADGLPGPYGLHQYVLHKSVEGWTSNNTWIKTTMFTAILAVILSGVLFLIGTYTAQSVILKAL